MYEPFIRFSMPVYPGAFHKSRHTAGQRVLDATGNLKAVQKLLGHASIQTTGDMTKEPIRNRSPRPRRKNSRFAAETRIRWRRWESNPRP
jgi:integrase